MATTEKTQSAVKIGLIVLYVLALIGCIALIVVAGIGLNKSETKKEDRDQEIIVIVLAIISLLFVLIGLIGIIKENKCIVIILFIFGIIGIIADFATGGFRSAIGTIIVTILTGVYAYLLHQRDKEGSNV